MKNINCKKCDDVVRVEKDVSKVTCGRCCATMGTITGGADGIA